MQLKSVQTGVVKVAIAGVLLMVAFLGGYYIYQAYKLKMQSEAEKEHRNKLVFKLLDASTEKYITPINDISAWDDLCTAVNDNDSAWIDENIGYMLKTYSATSLAIFGKDGTLLYRNDAQPIRRNVYGFDGKSVATFFEHRPFAIFTVLNDGLLLNYVGAGIVPSDDEYTRTTAPCGYIFLVRTITQEGLDEHCRTLGDIEAKLFTDSIQCKEFVSGLKDKDFVIKEMYDMNHKVSGYGVFTYDNPTAGQLSDFGKTVLIISGILLYVLISVVLYINKKITRPLRRISKAFQENNISPVKPLKAENNEFGQISEMMEDFFEQKEEIIVQNDKMQQLNDELQIAVVGLKLANDQVTSSIKYASRLQDAMLHAHAPGNGWFAESFTIYHPKDIVGGDFYVSQTLGKYRIALLGDCTGHGVPGAILVSMGISFLFQILDSRDAVFLPDIILNRLREKVVSAFSVSADGKQVEDGMDVALVIYNTETGESYFAGAGRPAVIVRNGELTIIKGDPMPIGHFVRAKDFTRQQLDLQPGDCVYLYSDGCTDQVGGPNNRKIMAKQFQEKILSVSTLPFPEQKEALEKFIMDWKGDALQTDDISLLAFRV